ncbi:hypothetical protein VitviT2T_018286 [Vitis vinifera]|uniref:AAA-type ATPase N-terminal domain-containing protein n=2 Tax=Vitis vinifera TaxID=29760 RepID=A0ABY9CYZ7_VITVI|nr:hypothetical protein VitviT2T_018286 [Vitis vinifera]
MKEFWSSLVSLLGVLAFCQSILHAVLPSELRFAALKLFKCLSHCSSYCYFDITEIDGVNTHKLYNVVQLYLSSSVSITSSRLSLTRALNPSSTTFGLSNNDSLVDTFNRVSVLWEHVVTQRQSLTFLRQQLRRLGAALEAATLSLSSTSLMVEASSEGDA